MSILRGLSKPTSEAVFDTIHGGAVQTTPHEFVGTWWYVNGNGFGVLFF